VTSPLSPPPLDRQALLADDGLTGAALCRAYSDRVDAWLGELFAGPLGAPDGIALVAVGGYGRAELSPQSDIDLLLCHDGRRDALEIGAIAEKLWYPIWDEGLKLGHAVRTVKEALDLASGDLDTATSLLSARPVAGDAALCRDLSERATALWRKRSKRFLGELSARVAARHERSGEVAFLLEPDLKEGRGGLRDVHNIRWAEGAERVVLEEDDAGLARAYELLLSVRVELHRQTGRPGDRLVLQEQDAVASRLGYADADALMAQVASSARFVAWISDDVWDRIDSSLRAPRLARVRRDKPQGEGVVLREGRAALTAAADPATDPLLVLRAATAAAEAGSFIERWSLRRLAEAAAPLPDPWPAEARELFARLLLAGPDAIPVIEALDQTGLFVGILPEWAPVRSKPQRNAYHRFTVDRHLVETAVEASQLVDRVDRPDLLVVGALLHDIGKGYPGDHTVVGIDHIERIGARMGYPADDVEVLCDLCRYHLLLPDVATRRDLSDDATITSVADTVGTPRLLHLLGALTEADSLATSTAAWGPWKAELVADLVDRVDRALTGGPMDDAPAEEFPTTEHLALLAAGDLVVEGRDQTLTVVAPDRPGLLSRVAGVLALHGLDVLSANGHSDDSGNALEVLRVESSFGPVITWDRVLADLRRALEGRLALTARLAHRVKTYGRVTPVAVPRTLTTGVRFDNDASSTRTVIEVHAADAIGMLFRITTALAEMDLDIRSAKVQTLGHEVIDTFYVCSAAGGKVTDPDDLAEIERAVMHALGDAG
jgi:[protein-PII] uridylyltransferase